MTVEVASPKSLAPVARARAAGPAPYALGPYPPLLRASLAIGLTAGFGYGLVVLLALALRWPLGAAWLPLAQAHGQAQIVGFVGLFVMAVGTVLFPRFLASPLRRPRLAAAGGLVLAVAVGLRGLAQPLEPSVIRSAILVLSGGLGPLGFALFALDLFGSMRRSVQPWDAWRLYAGAGLVAFALALGLNAAATAPLVGGSTFVPFALDEALVHLQLWGFVVPVTLAVGLKIFTRFLLLRPPAAGAFVPLLGAYLAGVGLVTTGWLMVELSPGLVGAAAPVRALGSLLEAGSLLGFVLALRLYRAPTRPAGTPHVIDPTRLWVRLAYGWLLLAAVLGAGFAVREALGGAGANFTEASAVRHALTMGYLLPLMAAMAGRLLPIYSADVLRHRRLLPTIVWLLFGGAALRVGGQLLGGYEPWVAPLVAAGGTLGTAGVVILAVGLWSSTNRLPASG